MSSEQRRGLLIVLSGPSGVGKDAAIHRLKEQGFDIHYVVTATTRARREGEREGIDYYFLQREEFEAMAARDAFLEWSVVHGNLYGPPIAQIEERLEAGQDMLLKIDVQGAAKVRGRAHDAVFIFLAPPSIEELVERLRARGTENPEELDVRIANAYKEMDALPAYDYVVVNHDGKLDEAADKIRCIITAERLRVHPRRAEIA
jgi:guanylate kinase